MSDVLKVSISKAKSSVKSLHFSAFSLQIKAACLDEYKKDHVVAVERFSQLADQIQAFVDGLEKDETNYHWQFVLSYRQPFTSSSCLPTC